MYLYFNTESEKDGNVIEYLPSESSHAADLLEWGEELAKIDNISSDVLQYFARHGLDNYDLFDGLPHECVLNYLQSLIIEGSSLSIRVHVLRVSTF